MLPVALAHRVGSVFRKPTMTGVVSTLAVSVAGEDGQLRAGLVYAAVATKVYEPDMPVLAELLTVVFGLLLLNPPGPVQLQLTGMVLVVLPVSESGFPLQTGLFEETTGRAGVESTITLVVAEGEVHPATVTVTL